MLPVCDFYLEYFRGIYLSIIALLKNVTRFGVGRLTNVVESKHFAGYLFDQSWPFKKCGWVSKTRDFFLVKLKNYLYIRHDGVLNVFLNRIMNDKLFTRRRISRLLISDEQERVRFL